MFDIGDKVVYPMHGAGIIEGIEEKEILGEKQSYYILRFPVGDMKVMIPTSNVEQVGIREVISNEEVDKVVAFCPATSRRCLPIGTRDIVKIWKR